jgi:hypothetical protein
MTLYYKPNETPSPPPARIILKNGQSRTNYSYTTEELLEAGYMPAPTKPSVQFPQRLDWVNNSWIIRDPNEGEVNTQILSIRAEAVRRLSSSDYHVTKAAEAGLSIPEAIKVYRQRLRDIYNLIDVPSIWAVEWPEIPTE